MRATRPRPHHWAMRDLPTGTVTFLFTDIEGSTRLLHEHGDGLRRSARRASARAARDLRAPRRRRGRHAGRRVLRRVRTRRTTRSRRPRRSQRVEGPVRVRIGIHTGTPTVTDEGYVGLDVHRAARICAAAHGGQVVLSEATRDALGRRSRPRPRAASAQGPRRAGAPVPARQGGVPATPLAQRHEPAGPDRCARRPDRGAASRSRP